MRYFSSQTSVFVSKIKQSLGMLKTQVGIVMVSLQAEPDGAGGQSSSSFTCKVTARTISSDTEGRSVHVTEVLWTVPHLMVCITVTNLANKLIVRCVTTYEVVCAPLYGL